MSDYYDLPFNDILDWDEFSVILKEDDVLELEKILKSIPQGEYEKMHQNVLKVDKNFIFIWDSFFHSLDSTAGT